MKSENVCSSSAATEPSFWMRNSQQRVQDATPPSWTRRGWVTLVFLLLSPQPLYGFHTSVSLTTLRSPPHSIPTPTTLFGIPKMFRWLTDQYPNINRRLTEGLNDDKIVDNFYLDMNGIIHPCTHGNSQDEIVVLDETAMFKKIFGYVDR